MFSFNELQLLCNLPYVFFGVCVCSGCSIIFTSSQASCPFTPELMRWPWDPQLSFIWAAQSGKYGGGNAEWCQHRAQERHPCLAPPFASSKVFGKTQEAKGLCGYHDQLSQGRGHLPPWLWALIACGSHRPTAAGAAGNALPSPASPVHFRTSAGKVVAKGIDTHMLGQKFRAGFGNWYKWPQTSCEAERVLTMWHVDLRDSCGELSLSLLLAWISNAVGQCLRSSHPFTLLPPSSISRVSRSAFAPRPSPPECCCGRASAGARSTVQKASVNYISIISHQQTHSLTAYGRWTNTCRLSGAEREADLFPELVTLISPSWSCKAECASVIFFFRCSYVAVRPITKSNRIFGMFLCRRQEGGWKPSLLPIALKAAWIQASIDWISKSQPCPVCTDSWFTSKGLQSPTKQGEKHGVTALGLY